jgi:alpha-galactosidase
MYYSKQHVGDRGSVDQDSLGKQGTEVAASGGLDVLAKPLANGDVSVVLFNENSSTATISTTAGAIGKTGASSYTLTNLWTGATSTTTGSIRPTPRGPR